MLALPEESLEMCRAVEKNLTGPGGQLIKECFHSLFVNAYWLGDFGKHVDLLHPQNGADNSSHLQEESSGLDELVLEGAAWPQ